jgi:hypothetical protein
LIDTELPSDLQAMLTQDGFVQPLDVSNSAGGRLTGAQVRVSGVAGRSLSGGPVEGPIFSVLCSGRLQWPEELIGRQVVVEGVFHYRKWPDELWDGVVKPGAPREGIFVLDPCEIVAPA